MNPRNTRATSPWLLLAAFALASSASAQESNCEGIRAQIESKVAASGVTAFTVTVVDANAVVGDQVVGSCALGTRKIVYARQRTAGESNTNATPPSPPRASSMLTECKDGSAPVNGACKR